MCLAVLYVICIKSEHYGTCIRLSVQKVHRQKYWLNSEEIQYSETTTNLVGKIYYGFISVLHNSYVTPKFSILFQIVHHDKYRFLMYNIDLINFNNFHSLIV
jgi:hypothetical protein